MSRPTRSLRLVILMCCVSLFAVVLPASSASARTHPTAYIRGTVDASAEQDFVNRTNALRASLGLGQLRVNSELVAKARAWSETQAQAGTIFHSTLSDGVTQNWHRLGENVGMGPSVGPIHDALVRSPRHYENLVDPGFTEIGIGVVRQGNVIYVSEVFMEFMPQQSAPPATQAPQTQKTASNNSVKTPTSGSAASSPTAPIEQAVPLKTASEDLTATLKKLSELEA